MAGPFPKAKSTIDDVESTNTDTDIAVDIDGWVPTKDEDKLLTITSEQVRSVSQHITVSSCLLVARIWCASDGVAAYTDCSRQPCLVIVLTDHATPLRSRSQHAV